MTAATARRIAAAIIAVPLLATRPSSQPTASTSRRQSTASARQIPARPPHSTSSSVVATRRPAANELLGRVRAVGYVDAEVRADGCGRWKVMYDGITSYPQGASSVAEARGAGLEAWLEIQPP